MVEEDCDYNGVIVSYSLGWWVVWFIDIILIGWLVLCC